ncbi:MAG: hypothetical protein ACUVWR_18465 [Anaerolineae bacterium]
MNELSERDLQLHVSVLGWLFIVGHALLLAVGAFVFLLLAGIGMATGDKTAFAVLGATGTAVGFLFMAIALPGLAAGVGLLARKAWGRILAIVVGVLGLVNFPVGTIIGAYALWVLLQNSASAYFGAGQMKT